MKRLAGEHFPYGTLLANVLGCLAIGALFSLVEDHPNGRAFLVIGLLGGFTTFSSYCLEVARLFEISRNWMAIFYFTISPAVGLMASFAGLNLSRLLFR